MLLIWLIILFVVGIVLFGIAFLSFFIYNKFRKNKFSTVKICIVSLITSFGIVLSFIICIAIISFCKSPMHVTHWNLKGNYSINTSMFDKKQAKWQYEHYKITIDDDSLYLKIFDNNKQIKTYSKKINFIKTSENNFITFYGDDYYADRSLSKEKYKSIKMDSTQHHLLKLNPILECNAFSFRLVMRSTKYGNMFFRRDNWWFFN